MEENEKNLKLLSEECTDLKQKLKYSENEVHQMVEKLKALNLEKYWIMLN